MAGLVRVPAKRHLASSARRLVSYIQPVRLSQMWTSYPELLLVAFCLAVLGLGRLLGLPLVAPDTHSIRVMVADYMLPLALASAFHFVLVGVRHSRGNRLLLLFSFSSLAIVTFCHFQFKAWMPLINPHRFGTNYEEVDIAFGPVIAFCGQVQDLVARTGLDVAFAYEGLFLLLFVQAFVLHGVYDNVTGQRQVILGVGWILALGGISYWIAPAVGPFVFRSGVSSNATLVQHMMLEKMNLLIKSRSMPPSYSVLAPAAMPSLHLAHTVFLIWMMRRISPWLSLAFVPLALWIGTAAIGLGWHYLVDIPAGVLLAFTAVFLVKKALPESASCEAREDYADVMVPDGLAEV